MKKGFTLVELLAVIVILALISLITVPLVVNTINNSKKSAEKRQIESIEKAAENWFIKQSYSLSNGSSKYYIVKLQTLIDDGYLDKTKIKNPNGGSEETYMEGCVAIKFSSNQYSYEYSENGCSCNSDNCLIIPTTNN